MQPCAVWLAMPSTPPPNPPQTQHSPLPVRVRNKGRRAPQLLLGWLLFGTLPLGAPQVIICSHNMFFSLRLHSAVAVTWTDVAAVKDH